MLKESADLDILGVTFDSKMTFEKHHRSVSGAASQRLGILRKSSRVFHDRLLLWRCFRGLVLPILEYWPAVWCLAADTHLKLLDRVVNGACFLAGGVLDCGPFTSSICGSIMYAVQDQMYPMHPLYGTLPVPYEPVRVTRGALVAHRYTYICASSLPNLAVLQDFYSPLSVSLEWS